MVLVYVSLSFCSRCRCRRHSLPCFLLSNAFFSRSFGVMAATGAHIWGVRYPSAKHIKHNLHVQMQACSLFFCNGAALVCISEIYMYVDFTELHQAVHTRYSRLYVEAVHVLCGRFHLMLPPPLSLFPLPATPITTHALQIVSYQHVCRIPRKLFGWARCKEGGG